jgi:hypothetical protein
MRTLALTVMAVLALASAQAASAQTRVQPTPPTPPAPTLQKKAPAPAMPDFVILHASAIGGKDNQFMVQVKNAGAANSPAAHLRSRNMASGNTGAALTSVPPIKAGQFVWVKVELNKSARPDNRILVEADYNKAVAETKENNNNYAFNW